MRLFLAHVMPYPRRLRLAMLAGVLGKPFAPLLAALGLKPLAAAARLAPLRAPGAMTEPGVYPASGPRRGAGGAARRLRQRGAGAVDHAGDDPPAQPPRRRGRGRAGRGLLRLARASHGPRGGRASPRRAPTSMPGPARSKARGSTPSSSPSRAAAPRSRTTASCCAPIRPMRRRRPRSRPGARHLGISGEARPRACRDSRPALTVAYHSACSLQHGQRVTGAEGAARRLGLRGQDVPEAHLCCGSAGTYNILQPDIAGRLRDRKVGNIEKIAPDMIAAGNIGCITQIAAGTAIPVVHPVELIDWATGGPMPEQLKGTRWRLGTESGRRRSWRRSARRRRKSRRRRSGPLRRAGRRSRRESRPRKAKKAKPKRREAKAKPLPKRAAKTKLPPRAAAPTAPRPMNAARSRGHADRAAAVAVPVVGAGRFPDRHAGRQEDSIPSFRGARKAREPGMDNPGVSVLGKTGVCIPDNRASTRSGMT